MSSKLWIMRLVPKPECRMVLYLCADRGIACLSSAAADVAVHPSHPCTILQGMQELHKAAPQTAGGEADPETQQAVQRVFNLVRNGTSGSAAKDCNLTLDDVVRFYNVRSTLARCATGSCTILPSGLRLLCNSISLSSKQPFP